MNYKAKLHTIRALVFDVDGVLTDGSVFLNPDGSMNRVMNVKDGYAMQYAVKKGYILAVITGGNEPEVKKRLQYLGLTDIYMKSHDKWEDYTDLKFKYGLKDEEILYVGDDIPDLQLLEKSGVGVAPQDAAAEAKKAADYVSPFNGGKGVVRDVIEQTLKVQGNWLKDFNVRSI